ncbi:MAG TPA: hypothetical protein PLX97_10575, partial [Gemmatales bacterium]|nr:hypothetical protein [Gemmatales bacterium]
MLRWYFGVALSVLASTSLQAQNTGNTGALGTGSNMGTGSSTGGLAGQVNTTLLGSTVNLNFNSV